MNGKINKDGNLEIERKQTFKIQYCPFVADAVLEKFVECGDWCPLFGEPKRRALNNNDSRFFELFLCKKKLIFDKFTDERS